MKLQLLIASVLLLASCAPWRPLGSYEPQKERNYDRDLYECERDATLAGPSDKQHVFDECMQARGYKQK